MRFLPLLLMVRMYAQQKTSKNIGFTKQKNDYETNDRTRRKRI